jgi:arsenate reductase
MTVEPAGVQGSIEAASAPQPIRVIFICTGNSARSQMAEALLRHDAGDRFEVVSAGVSPRSVHPLTVAALAGVGIDISAAVAKPVGMFLGKRFDYVITLCDRARVTCPVFPGGSETLHWGLDDPTETKGTDAEQRAAFDLVLKELAVRLNVFRSMALSRAAR